MYDQVNSTACPKKRYYLQKLIISTKESQIILGFDKETYVDLIHIKSILVCKIVQILEQYLQNIRPSFLTTTFS